MQDTSHPEAKDPEQHMRMTPPAAGHARAQQVLEATAQNLDRTSRLISTARLVTLVAVVTLALVLGFGYVPTWMWWLAGMLAAGFVVLVVWHARLDAAESRVAAAISFHRWAIERILGRFHEYPARGDRFASDAHPYTADLGIFGEASLFQLLDQTHTRRGEDCLAAWLSRPIEAHSVPERQTAVRELSRHEAMREELAVLGTLIATDKPNPDPLLGWAEGEPALSPAPFVRVLAFGLPILTGVIFLLVAGGVLSSAVGLAMLAVQWIYGLSLLPKIEPVAGKVTSREGALARYRSMLEVIERAPFDAPQLRRLQGELLPSPPSELRASQEIRRLSAIVGFLDARQNEVFKFFIGPLLLWDVHCVLRLEAWQKRAGKKARRWLEIIGEVEALSSLAGFAHDHPEYIWPEVSEAAAFRAKQLGHPLIDPQSRVKNDVTLRGAGTALLVTGSNMSGKSTLLRAMGINTVLAMAGAPVVADALLISPFELRTSMWARDSLVKGVSHFYAELEKLKRVVDGIESPQPLLFLLDEILQGTNSRERVIGARSVLRHLLDHGAMGAVSTHDIGLLELDAALDAKLDKVHFEEQVSQAADGTSAMTFDYTLRSGVVRSTNALRLMKMVGIDVDVE